MAEDDNISPEGTPSENANETGARGFLCENLELAEKLKSALIVLKIPSAAQARADGRAILAVPAALAQQAAQALQKAPGIALEQGPEPYLRKFDPAKDETVHDHPVFRLATPDLRKRGQAALDELYHCVLKGTPQVVERAVMTLGRMGRDGHATLDRLTVLGVQMGNPAFVGLLMREGKIFEGRAADRLPEGLLPLRELARHANPAIRQQAVRVLGGLRILEVIPDLANALLDTSEDVAIEADDAFLHWGANDERFEPDLPPAEKNAIAERRRSFRPR